MIEKRLFYYMVTTLLLCIGMGARAANVVTISSAEGVPGEEVTVSIGLQNTDALSSMQLSIPLDENLTLVSGSAVVDNRCASHTANIGVNNGTLQIVVYSLSMATIAPGNGEVVSFKLKLGNEPLNATLQPSKIVLTGASGSAVNGSSESGTVTIRSSKAQFSTDEIDFGRVPIRSTYTQELTVTNVGTADLVVNSLEFSDNVFSTSTQLPLTIAPGSTASLNVTFAPTMRGELERQLRVITNSATQNHAIRLKAQPYAVNELHIDIEHAFVNIDEEVTVTMRMNNMDDISGYQVDFDLPSSLQYVDGSFVVNANRKQDHTGIATVVDGTLRLVAYSPSGIPLKGNDGEICSFRLKVIGQGGADLTPTKTILSSIINNKVENVVSDVHGVRVIVVAPEMYTDDEIDFGDVSITEECKKTFTISNYGSPSLTISRILFDNQNLVVAEQMPLVIPGGESKDVTVIYNSVEQKAFEATMQIYSNDPDKRLHEVKVKGSRFAPNYLDVNIPNVFEEDSLNIHLSLNTFDNVTGLQFDLNYPNNLYVPFENNVQLADRAKGLTVSSRQVNENTIRYVCYYLSGNGIAAGEGDIMTIQLKPVNALTPAGTYSVDVKNVTLGTAGLTNKYAGRDLERSFQVKKHNSIVITAKSYTREYGSANPVFGYNVEGTSDLYGSPDIRCDATETSPVGEYPIVISKGNIDRDEVSYVNGTLTITKAPLKVIAGTYTKKQGEAMPEFSVSYDGFKNEETAAVLSKPVDIICDANANSAPGEYDITLSGAEAQNYDISYTNGKLIVVDADAMIVKAKSYTREYGEGNPVFEFTTEGGELEGMPEIICEATETSPVGTYDIIVRTGSVANHNVAYVNGTLTITKAPLTISAGTYVKAQGEAMPQWELKYIGFRNNETKDVLTKQPVVSCDATQASDPGTYPVTVSGAEAQNYEISYVEGSLMIYEVESVTVTAKSYTREYGEDNPSFEFTSEGASLEGTPEIICEATATSPVGEYPIIIRKGSVTNFNDRYVNGTLTVIKAPLYIKADDKSMTMGETLPEFTLSYEGFKNNETEEVLTKKPVVSCEATEMSAPGNYDITLSGAEAQNYEIEYVNGTLTINDVGYVMVTAKSYTRVYGEPNPTFEFTSEGARLFGTPEIICEATATSPVGEYPIIIRKGSVTNSNDYYINGVLTITEAQLMIIAEDKTMKVGDPMPEFTVIYEGFKNNETEDVLLNLPEVSCSAYEDSPPGKYIIVPCCAQAENYMIDVVNGTLTITEAAPVTITAKSYTREYGEANPVFEYTSEGADVEGTPEIICNATASSPVGEYPIVIRKGSVSNSNDSYVNGVLTITKAPLTITAGNYTKKQYDPMPDFLVNYDGFKNGETADVLTKQVVISCDANEDSAPGEYDITLSGAEAENYDITYVAGKLTVNEPDSYTLTYLVDGEVYQSFSIKYRDVITPLDGLEKEGYTFSGWSEIPATMPAHDVVITGTFKVNKYLLTYQVDGEIVKSDSIVFNTPITPEAEPSKEGYTFSGWSEIPATMPAHDVVITGTFKVNKYLLTYQVDGEIVKSDSIVFNTAITPEAEPTKEGYTFSGWSEIPETMPANDVIVTGTFKINKYLLTYKVDDEIVKSDSIVYNTAITPEAEPMKEGYTFSGWSEIPETMPAHDLTIYGTFTINTYKLTYMIDDAVYKVVDYEYGATITPEPQPEGDYASFEWVELPETMPAHDVTVHASYVTGITDISTAEKIVRIYCPNGKVLNKPQKGLNLVFMRDGTIRKIVIK